MLNRHAVTPLTGHLRGQNGPPKISGVVDLVAGIATVSTPYITANSILVTSHKTPIGTLGALTVSTRTPGVSFTITSLNVLDTSTVSWMILEP